MRIAQVAPLAEAVPPRLYGGTERVVFWLTEELLRMGHEVTLFASGDSETNAKLEPCWPEALRLSPGQFDPMLPYAVMLQRLADRMGEFDVIHCHTDWLHIPLLRGRGVPFVTTLHGRLDLPHLETCFGQSFADAPMISISEAQRGPLPQARWIATVYHGIPEDLFVPNLVPEGYLAFLGRIAPEKGPEAAIHLARAAGLPLKIAAKVDKADREYFKERVEPLIDGDQIQHVGEIDERQKQAFLGNAAALLFPICWPEPFGLVMVEAMACGSPVIAFRAGSVPEIIDDGLTGFIVDADEAIAAAGRIRNLDRQNVRRRFEQRFTARRMAEDYIRLYEGLLAQVPSTVAI
jgi:glycosyltransferase involved in cell wall biosynthesis